MKTDKMPLLFVGHGSPMNAIEDNEFGRTWAEIAETVQRPKAVLCISAHWETNGTAVTAMESPRTIHDFFGFPAELFSVDYPAPGSPDLAQLVHDTVPDVKIGLDHEWGIDHGAWSVLRRMYPQADIPVVQLSLDRTEKPAFHYALGKSMAILREQGILILGSGNIVHNLRMVEWMDAAFDWAVEFDDQIARLIESGDHDPIINYERLGGKASLAVPTNEHFLPLLYALGLQQPGEEVRFFAEGVTLGSISMRSLVIG